MTKSQADTLPLTHCLATEEIEGAHGSDAVGNDKAQLTPNSEHQEKKDVAADNKIVETGPKKSAWGLSTNAKDGTTDCTKGTHAPPTSFAEIMNNQIHDRDVARLAYSVDQNMSLAEIQAEQERLFSSLTSKNNRQSASSTGAQHDTSNMEPNLLGIDEEERKMIEMAMKQSMEDCYSNTKESTHAIAKADSAAAASTVATAGTQKSEEEAEREMIEAAIREADKLEEENASNGAMDTKPAARTTTSSVEVSEQEMIEAAIREADAKERADAEAESLKLILQLQQEEVKRARELQQNQRHAALTSGNVRTMTRAELAAETYSDKVPFHEYDDSLLSSETGFRMNQQNQDQVSGWYRRDRNTIVGPDNEIRTKHDVKVQGQTNASFLDLDIVDDDTGLRTHVGNTAFNAFRKTVAGSYHAKGGHRGTSKGVATYGTGRAGSDADATKGGNLDQHVRLQISKAINAGIIEQCNGIVKQGKEAVVYHAVGATRSIERIDESSESVCVEENKATEIGETGISDNDGFDVAIKVFKRIKEFKGRGEYVDGDPRYAGRPFRSFTGREQLEVWTEKEYRNLVRAYRAEVPVPNPIHYKDNIIFMRFLGQDGWPAPQIREINVRKGSSKWTALYEQVMESVRRLFRDARLVHGDLSEYNILIAPNVQVDHKSRGIESEEDLQTVLIDFGQAVEVRHPKAEELLRRDLERVRQFFVKQGVKNTMTLEKAMEFVVDDHSFSVNMNDTKILPHDT